MISRAFSSEAHICVELVTGVPLLPYGRYLSNSARTRFFIANTLFKNDIHDIYTVNCKLAVVSYSLSR